MKWSETVALLGLLVLVGVMAIYGQQDPKPIPPVTDSEKMWLELKAMRRIQDAILIYVRPDDEYAEKFAKTLREAGIPQLPGVSR